MIDDYPLGQCGKRCFSHREDCQQIADARKNNHLHHMKKIPKRAYYCEICGAYHLSSSAKVYK